MFGEELRSQNLQNYNKFNENMIINIKIMMYLACH